MQKRAISAFLQVRFSTVCPFTSSFHHPESINILYDTGNSPLPQLFCCDVFDTNLMYTVENQKKKKPVLYTHTIIPKQYVFFLTLGIVPYISTHSQRHLSRPQNHDSDNDDFHSLSVSKCSQVDCRQKTLPLLAPTGFWSASPGAKSSGTGCTCGAIDSD